MNKFAMYGKLTAHPGQRDALVQLMLEAADQLDAMEGCELYIINVSEEDPNVVWVTELWRDAEAHAASLKNEYVLALIQSCRPLIAGVEPVKLRPVGGKGL
ncbi:antibiotic biosynthesis monooxygenase [Gordoniibacillus kamchatkensis]|uniref:Antibiotic biosynthesis monooxygenase n=1 Tax=Gordoniibacillus kamchatkensis TaxID=1590651 RepID=A0ABR5AI62_9BACL|nr:putative quinol monooxygenase [Paenibacillus sp. VKM B-2647]KIL40582.1 antibiotic biosynthesis monooxygenase [Paenibacillus sp. VKM B-2647]